MYDYVEIQMGVVGGLPLRGVRVPVTYLQYQIYVCHIILQDTHCPWVEQVGKNDLSYII